MRTDPQPGFRAYHILLFILVVSIGTVVLAVARPLLSPKVALRTNGVVATEKDNGKEITVPKGSTFAVSLEITSGTGYAWNIAKDGAPLLKSIGKPQIEKPTDSMPGATQRQVFRFQASDSGSANLELRYARPWEKEKPPARTFTLKVNVP
jgi:inhibitor of cysteine peptidase